MQRYGPRSKGGRVSPSNRVRMPWNRSAMPANVNWPWPNLSRHSALIRQIRGGSGRIEAGTFGVCQCCEKPIRTNVCSQYRGRPSASDARRPPTGRTGPASDSTDEIRATAA